MRTVFGTNLRNIAIDCKIDIDSLTPNIVKNAMSYFISMVFSVHPMFGNHVPNQGIMVQIWETWSLFGPSFWLSPKPKPKSKK